MRHKKRRDIFVSRRERGKPDDLQGTQEVQNILLLAGRQVVVENRLDCGSFAAVAFMSFDCAQQVSAAAIVEEEEPLAQTPQWS